MLIKRSLISLFLVLSLTTTFVTSSFTVKIKPEEAKNLPKSPDSVCARAKKVTVTGTKVAAGTVGGMAKGAAKATAITGGATLAITKNTEAAVTSATIAGVASKT